MPSLKEILLGKTRLFPTTDKTTTKAGKRDYMRQYMRAYRQQKTQPKRKASVRAQTTITFHGRTGKPMLHWTPDFRPYIMVRTKGGGTKRLYLDTKKAAKQIEGILKLRVEAMQRRR